MRTRRATRLAGIRRITSRSCLLLYHGLLSLRASEGNVEIGWRHHGGHVEAVAPGAHGKPRPEHLTVY